MFLSNPALAEMETYTAGLPREYVSRRYGIPLQEVAKLGSAENPFGPSPKAVEAVKEALSRLDIYPSWTAEPLRGKLAGKYGFNVDQIVIGAGETEIIPWLIQVFAEPGGKVLMHAPTFPIYHMSAYAQGREPVFINMAPEFDFRVEDFIAAIDDDIRIVFITNPHSPTGLWQEEATMRKIIEATTDQLVVLDEAYVHFSDTNGYIHLANEYDNVIVMRTFSKVFGLAGLRVGFAVGHHHLIRPLLAVKPVWNSGQLQVAGAMAALDDDEHTARTISTINAMRDYAADGMDGMKRFSMIEGSRSNFFTVEITDPTLDSTSVFNALLERGVIVKDGTVSFQGYGDRYLRVDVSIQKHMDRFLSAMSELDRGVKATG